MTPCCRLRTPGTRGVRNDCRTWLAGNDSVEAAGAVEPIEPVLATGAAGSTVSGRPASTAGADEWCRSAAASVATVGTVNARPPLLPP